MSWAFKAVGGGGGANPTINAAANVPGDLMVLVALSEAASYATLAGWNELLRETSGSLRVAVWWKISTGQGAVSFTNADTTCTGAMLSYSGLDGDAYNSQSAVASVNATSIATNTLTTAEDNELVISCYAGISFASIWGSAPASTINRVSGNPTSSRTGLAIVDENQASAGTSTARTQTIDTSITLKAISLSFKQAKNSSGLFFGSNF